MTDVNENALQNDQAEAVIDAVPPEVNEDAGASAEAGSAEEKIEAAKKRDYRQERIDRLTRENAEKERKLAAAEARAAAAEAIATARREANEDKPATGSGGYTEADIDRLADEKLSRRSFEQGTQRVADMGRSEFPDFQRAIDNMSANFGDRIPKHFYDAIIELPNGHEVFRDIALDDDLADRVLSMSPTKMALEIGKLAGRIKAPASNGAAISRVPAPIAPVRGAAPTSRSLYDDKMNRDDWFAQRNAEAAKVRKR